MNDETRGRFEELCEQAAKEQDSAKLLELATEINQILAEKQNRLNKANLKT
jgi:hypothetical protein